MFTQRTVEGKKYLDWAKGRAMQILDEGDVIGAYTSFASDLKKNEELKDHMAIQMGLELQMIGSLSKVEEMRKFINDFN